MKVLLIDIDSKMPNLALMKVSAYHRREGDEVGWAWAKPDRVYISCIFSENLPNARGVAKFYPDADVRVGGPALGYPNYLPDEMEHSMPDYALYPDMDYSMGFSTRGCIRNCPFCVVPEIEGRFREHAPISEFHNPDFDKLMLFDNNFLASTRWKEKLDYIKDHDLKVSFNQGLDARLIDNEKASALAETQSYNSHFTSRKYYFAWDLIENEKSVLRGIQKMIDVGISPQRIMVYLLVGFNTSHEQDYHRFSRLRELDVEPFVMVYNNRRDDPWIRYFARWVNRPWFYKNFDFVDYDRLSPSLRKETESILEAERS